MEGSWIKAERPGSNCKNSAYFDNQIYPVCL
jgi:hypothetical protein